MGPIDATQARHSVRKYADQPLEKAQVETIREATGRINAESGLNVQLVLDEPKAFNQQKFKFVLHDLGIVKCHFEIGAGKENFRWK